MVPTKAGATLRVGLIEGPAMESRGADFELQRRVVEMLYGSDVASSLSPWSKPAPPPGLMETARRLFARTQQREQEFIRERAAAESAAASKIATARYGAANVHSA